MPTAIDATTNTPTIGAVQSQLSDLQAQQAALGRYGLSDTTQLIKDTTGAYVPRTPTGGGAGAGGGSGAGNGDPYALYTTYKNGGGNLDMTAWETAGRPGSVQSVGNLYGGIYSPDPNAAAMSTAQGAAAYGYNNGQAPSQTDTYTEALNEYQDQIDAINSLYAGKRADVTKQYTDLETQRMGSEGALLANSGMAGSTFGNSKTNELGISNENELKTAQGGVDAEQAAAIASIMTQVRTQADKSYQDKLAAYSAGADKTVQYLKDQATQKDTNATQVAQNAILKNLDLSDPKNSDVVNQIAKSMGVDPSVLVDKYKAAKAAYDQAQTTQKATNDKAAADLAKTIQDTAKTKSDIAVNNAQIAKINSDIANGGTYQSGGLKIGKSDLSDIQSVLKNGNAQKGLLPSGKDLYANTNTYITLYNHWVNPASGQGGLGKDFISLFPPKTYLNPNDPTIPDALKNAINSSNINITIPGVGQ